MKNLQTTDIYNKTRTLFKLSYCHYHYSLMINALLLLLLPLPTRLCFHQH